jgi:hypothetical protein
MRALRMSDYGLATRDQRWTIYELFLHFGIRDIDQMCADAARILKLDGLALTDLRDLTYDDAIDLITELREAAARERVASASRWAAKNAPYGCPGKSRR